MTSGQYVHTAASPMSKKNRWLRIQELHNDCDKLDEIMDSGRFGPVGNARLLKFKQLLQRTISELERPGL